MKSWKIAIKVNELIDLYNEAYDQPLGGNIMIKHFKKANAMILDAYLDGDISSEFRKTLDHRLRENTK